MASRKGDTKRIAEAVTDTQSFATDFILRERGIGEFELGPAAETPKINLDDLTFTLPATGPGFTLPPTGPGFTLPPGIDLGAFIPPGGVKPPPRPPADPDIPRFAGEQTTTRLVTYAVDYLENLPREPLQSALNFIQAKPGKVRPGELLEDLRQRTSFDEVLREKAEGWKPVTRRVFAEVFAMPADSLASMDAIVAVALLNRPDLEQVLRRENAAPLSLQQLLENRKIVWQYPAPGTPLTPPYVIVVAVESTDTAPAEDIVQRIMSNLVLTPSGFRLPRGAAGKLG